MTEGYLAGNILGSFDGFLTTINKSDLTFEDSPNLNVKKNELKEEIILFPNPTNGSKLNILNRSNSKINSIRFLNSIGQEVIILSKNSQEIDLAQLSNGLYFIEIYFDSNKVVQKILKN